MFKENWIFVFVFYFGPTVHADDTDVCVQLNAIHPRLACVGCLSCTPYCARTQHTYTRSAIINTNYVRTVGTLILQPFRCRLMECPLWLQGIFLPVLLFLFVHPLVSSFLSVSLGQPILLENQQIKLATLTIWCVWWSLSSTSVSSWLPGLSGRNRYLVNTSPPSYPATTEKKK